MSIKFNKITKLENKNLDLNVNKEFLNVYTFSKYLKKSLEKKGILLTKIRIKKTKPLCFIKMNLFFNTQKLMKYKNFFNNKGKKKSNKQNFNNIIIKKLKCQGINIQIINLNKFLNLNEIKFYFNSFKKFRSILFTRQFGLFIDFLKLTVLFINKKISNDVYITILAKIFKTLTKSKHARYIFFINQLFDVIIESSTNKICGLKLEIYGKLKGKLRSSSEKIIKGNISAQTIDKNVEYTQNTVYTIYGTFGIKLWTHYSN